MIWMVIFGFIQRFPFSQKQLQSFLHRGFVGFDFVHVSFPPLWDFYLLTSVLFRAAGAERTWHPSGSLRSFWSVWRLHHRGDCPASGSHHVCWRREDRHAQTCESNVLYNSSLDSKALGRGASVRQLTLTKTNETAWELLSVKGGGWTHVEQLSSALRGTHWVVVRYDYRCVTGQPKKYCKNMNSSFPRKTDSSQGVQTISSTCILEDDKQEVVSQWNHF